MSIKDLKNRFKNAQIATGENTEKPEKPQTQNYKDENILKLIVDEADNGSMTGYFMPLPVEPINNVIPWHKQVLVHELFANKKPIFKGISPIQVCHKQFGSWFCPWCEVYFKLYKEAEAKSEGALALVKKFKNKNHYYANFYVQKCISNPELNDRLFILNFTSEVFTLLDSIATGVKDEDPDLSRPGFNFVNPFNTKEFLYRACRSAKGTRTYIDPSKGSQFIGDTLGPIKRYNATTGEKTPFTDSEIETLFNNLFDIDKYLEDKLIKMETQDVVPIVSEFFENMGMSIPYDQKLTGKSNVASEVKAEATINNLKTNSGPTVSSRDISFTENEW